jgi:hypothetical protein
MSSNISGNLGTTGAGVGGGTVTATPTNYAGSSGVFSANGDTGGNFTLTGLPQGTYIPRFTDTCIVSRFRSPWTA